MCTRKARGQEGEGACRPCSLGWQGFWWRFSHVSDPSSPFVLGQRRELARKAEQLGLRHLREPALGQCRTAISGDSGR